MSDQNRGGQLVPPVFQEVVTRTNNHEVVLEFIEMFSEPKDVPLTQLADLYVKLGQSNFSRAYQIMERQLNEYHRISQELMRLRPVQSEDEFV